VFKWPLKTCNDGDDVTCACSPSQTRAAETGNARSPTVHRDVLVETTRASDDESQSHCE